MRELMEDSESTDFYDDEINWTRKLIKKKLKSIAKYLVLRYYITVQKSDHGITI